MPTMRLALLGSWHLWLVTAGNLSYSPAAHEKLVGVAFEDIYDESFPSSPMKTLISNYKQVRPKGTQEGCQESSDCYAADCLLNKCICPDEYGTTDGEKCKYLARPLDEWPDISRDTGGSCVFFACDEVREAECVSFGIFDKRCLCNSTYASDVHGNCRPVSEVRESRVKAQLKLMMQVGAAEPDDLPCPGAKAEVDSEFRQMQGGTRVYEMGICRKCVQAYHGSPLPLVVKADLKLPPTENGYQGKDNLRSDLYSLMTLRQWRSWVVTVMAKEFFYSMVMEDVSEGARRLGNSFHTLANTFTAGIVVRKSKNDVASHAASHISENCNNWIVEDATSMNVVNWDLIRIAAENSAGPLFTCATYFVKKALVIWAEARIQVENDYSAAKVNLFLDDLLNNVFCPALHIPQENLDTPAGGSIKAFSSDSWKPQSGEPEWGKPLLPHGVAAREDADRIINDWVKELESLRKKLPTNVAHFVPDGLLIPSREVDVCADPDIIHVTEDDMKQYKDDGIIPGYLLPTRQSAAEVIV